MQTRVLKAGPAAVEAAAKVVLSGGIVGMPTDTVYGLCCDPRDDKAVAGLFEVKNREAKPVPVLCADFAVANRLVALNKASRRLADGNWPGALTIVAPLKQGNGLSRLLDQGSGALGVRVPDSKHCTGLARRVGGAVTGTSANISGVPSSRTAAQVVESFRGKIPLVVDGGSLLGKESTVVKVTGETIEVLREGSVSIQEGKSKP